MQRLIARRVSCGDSRTGGCGGRISTSSSITWTMWYFCNFCGGRLSMRTCSQSFAKWSGVMRRRNGEAGGGAYRHRPRGIPIGNVTSQIFANIILHEFDRFVVHTLHPSRYLRYGDDFLLIGRSACELEEYRERAAVFLRQALQLGLHPRNDLIVPIRRGVRFLGQEMFPKGRRLVRRTRRRWEERLRLGNIASYHGLVRNLRSAKVMRLFHWKVFQLFRSSETLR